MTRNGTLSWDWYGGVIPHNVELGPSAYIETSYSFYLYRSEIPVGLRLGRGASAYGGTMFDIGPQGRVRLGDYTLVHGAWITCDSEVEIGDFTLISWNVVMMDSYRASRDPIERRRLLEGRPCAPPLPKRIVIGSNVWIGFEVCVLPGVMIGDGAIVGARSVLVENVPAYSLVAGNPARVIRTLEGTQR